MNVQIDISTKPESGDEKNPKLKVHFYPLAHHKLRPNFSDSGSGFILFDPTKCPTTYHPWGFPRGNPGGVQSWPHAPGLRAVKIHLTFDERPRDLYNLWLLVDRSKEIRSGTAEK